MRKLALDTKKIMMAAVVALIIVMAVAASTLFIHTMFRIVSQNVYSDMTELTAHDSLSLSASVESRWEAIDQIGKRLSIAAEECENDPDPVTAMKNRLAQEAGTVLFDTVYIYATNGYLYTGRYSDVRLDTGYPELNNVYNRHKGKSFVSAFVRNNGTEETRVLVYGCPIDAFTVNGKECVYIFGECPVNSLKNEISLTSYNGRGKTGLIVENGNYIVNPTHAGGDVPDNFINDIKSNPKNSETTVNEVKAVLRGDKPMYCGEFLNEKNEKSHFCIKAVDDYDESAKSMDFFVCLEVSERVFTSMRWNYLLPAFVFTFTVAVIIAVFLAIYFVTNRKAVRAAAVADAKTEFLSTLSHEIRTPLNGIIGLNYLMKMHMDEPDKMTEYVNETSETAQYLLTLVNDILDFSKLNSGKFTTYNDPYDVKELISTLHAMQRDNAASRSINFVVNADITVPCVLGDVTRIKQVLMNIIGNAMKFTPAGGTITFSTAQSVNELNEVITKFTVSDTGCGMSEEFQKHIFEAFTQERNKHSSEQKGTGLGMSISYLLVKQMGGNITVSSELGKGSTFCVALPSVAGEMEQETAVHNEAFNPADVRILVAEDNELNRMILMDILEEAGFAVEGVEDGRLAVEEFNRSEIGYYNLILMDMQMPVLDGCSATREIRKLPRADAKSIRIFACTANSFREDIDKVYESGMDDYLAKPVDIPTMIKKIKGIG